MEFAGLGAHTIPAPALRLDRCRVHKPVACPPPASLQVPAELVGEDLDQQVLAQWNQALAASLRLNSTEDYLHLQGKPQDAKLPTMDDV